MARIYEKLHIHSLTAERLQLPMVFISKTIS
jgi:hypothetical protein